MKEIFIALKYLLSGIFILFLSLASTQAQQISVYSDYLEKVYVFDNGTHRQIEHLPLKSYKVGNQALAYEDNTGNFKIFFNNYLFSVSSFVSEYQAFDNLIVFRMNTQLKVFDNGQVKNLSTNITDYAAGDDVVIFFDDLKHKLMAYCNSQFFELEDALNVDSLSNFICGENTIVFCDSKNYFHIFYDEKSVPLAYSERIKSVKAGRNIVAFVEEPINNFQIFYNDEIMELESFEPVSYNCGDDLLAYVDANNYLKVFADGDLFTLSFDQPNFYEVVDELVVYSVQTDFKVFWHGKTYTLENMIPAKYNANNDMVVYIDEHGYLKLFEKGQTKTISYEKIDSFELTGSCVKYSFGVKSQNIYLNGNTYSNN